MKNKKILIPIITVVVLLVLGIGGVVLLHGKSEQPTDDTQGVQQTALPKIDPKTLGLEIIPSADKKYVQFKMTNLKDIKHIEWDFSYDADVPQTPGEDVEPGARVTQEFGGEKDITPDMKEFTSDKRELGTCSTGGKCRFDTGIKTINLDIQIKKTDGKTYQTDTSQPL